MLTKLWCWLFGHKLWAKAITSTKTGIYNPLTGEEGLFYRWEKQRFCLRCGHEPPAPCLDPEIAAAIRAIRSGAAFKIVNSDGKVIADVPACGGRDFEPAVRTEGH